MWTGSRFHTSRSPAIYSSIPKKTFQRRISEFSAANRSSAGVVSDGDTHTSFILKKNKPKQPLSRNFKN